MCRFTTGGYQFIDNRAFFEDPCDIMVFKEHIFFKDIRHRATVRRSEDWGWSFIDDNTSVVLYSFDHRVEQRLFQFPLQLPDGSKVIGELIPLVSAQKDNQLNETFRIIPCETYSIFRV